MAELLDLSVAGLASVATAPVLATHIARKQEVDAVQVTANAALAAATAIVNNAFEALAPSSAGATTLAMAAGVKEFIVSLSPGAGGGVYTRKVVLPVAGREAGHRCEVLVQMPASANPTLAFHNADDTGAALFTVAPDADTVRSYLLKFIHNGTGWILFGFFQNT